MFIRALAFLMLFSVILLSGCAISHPQTADEFRKAAPGATFGKTESFVVNRQFKSVANSFKKMAPKCLNKRIKTTSSGYMHYQVIVTRYRPTVRISRSRAELHLQQEHEQGVMNVSKMPQGGYFLLVADATQIGKKKTQIDMYYPSVGHDLLVNAIKGWAKGNKSGCPDLAKM